MFDHECFKIALFGNNLSMSLLFVIGCQIFLKEEYELKHVNECSTGDCYDSLSKSFSVLSLK